uniref:HAT C-terminal dimerisation domain-containing protein n=1 Tax=Acrobeloides nanus TaxID=290746 RepID=A0A914D690_9BILA
MMLRLWDPLYQLFTGCDKPPRILEDFFKSNESRCVLEFLQSVLAVFERPLLLLQKPTLLLPELLSVAENFMFQIKNRQERAFFGSATATSLRILSNEAAVLLQENFLEFYTTVIDYVEKWFRSELLPSNISWVMLTTRDVDYNEVVELARQIAPDIAEMDELFNEVMELNRLIKQIPDTVFNEDSAETKWMKVFQGNYSFPCIYKLVSIILSIPVSNAFVEQVFSLCGAQWTDQRNSLKPETVKALLQVRVNFDLTCNEMFKFLMKNNSLRQKIRGAAKWE